MILFKNIVGIQIDNGFKSIVEIDIDAEEKKYWRRKWYLSIDTGMSNVYKDCSFTVYMYYRECMASCSNTMARTQ